MDFTLTEEQSMLRDMVAAYLGDQYDFARRHAAMESAEGWRPDVWRAFAEELGILGAVFPMELGGFGGGPVETMVLMDSFGKALLLEPFLPTVVIGGGFLRHGGYAGAAELAGDIIAGRAILAFAQSEADGRYNLSAISTRAEKDGAGWVLDGAKAAVVAAPFSTHLIVTARTAGGLRDEEGVSVFLVDRHAPGISIDAYVGADGLRAANVRFDHVKLGSDALIGELDHGLPLIERVLDEAIVASCAEACGVMRVLLDDTVEYTKQRKQFGVPLGSFQVLQHRMADMFIHLEQSVSMTMMATIRAIDGRGRARAASAAKVQIGKACRFVGESAIQLHGGMGMTDEMAISHYFRRATMIESSFGSVDHHLARFERLG